MLGDYEEFSGSFADDSNEEEYNTQKILIQTTDAILTTLMTILCGICSKDSYIRDEIMLSMYFCILGIGDIGRLALNISSNINPLTEVPVTQDIDAIVVVNLFRQLTMTMIFAMSLDRMLRCYTESLCIRLPLFIFIAVLPPISISSTAHVSDDPFIFLHCFYIIFTFGGSLILFTAYRSQLKNDVYVDENTVIDKTFLCFLLIVLFHFGPVGVLYLVSLHEYLARGIIFVYNNISKILYPYVYLKLVACEDPFWNRLIFPWLRSDFEIYEMRRENFETMELHDFIFDRSDDSDS